MHKYLSVEEKHDYYKDENNKYISCSTLDNCLTCISSSVCTSCKEGFTIGNDKCEKNEEKKDDGDLSTGAIIGIACGCLLFLLLLLLIFYLIYRKMKKSKEKNIQQTYDQVDVIEQKAEKDNQKRNNPQEIGRKSNEDFMVYSRRNISNQN